MSEIKDFLKLLGGGTKVAVKCQVSPSAISRWIERQSIPARQALNILALAAENDIQLTPTEFLEQFTKSKISKEVVSKNDNL